MIKFAHLLGGWGVAILVLLTIWSMLCSLAKRRGERERDRRELRRAAEKERKNNGETNDL